MRGLAEYAMHGRRQAIIIVLLCGFFPMAYFVSAAIMALVNLRKDTNEGLIILLWSLLPAVLHWVMMGDSTPVTLMLSVAGLSQVLKRTDSWQIVIFLSVLVGLLAQLSLIWQPEYVALVKAVINEAMTAQLEQGAPAIYTAEQLVELWVSLYGAYHSLAIVVCLLIARWWQAALYNPGGFRQEFHFLRFDPRLMLPLVGLICLGLMTVAPFESWLTMLYIPPMFGGLSLVHYEVARKEMNKGWLVLCYLVLLLMTPVIIILGLLDSVFDIRKRITA